MDNTIIEEFFRIDGDKAAVEEVMELLRAETEIVEKTLTFNVFNVRVDKLRSIVTVEDGLDTGRFIDMTLDSAIQLFGEHLQG
ncbi:hypothetical protein [Rhodococcus sp. ARC_M6]|uniref:hypothetical protein n=1 Tax=Rhodococcus sp. ARC_M6 TaxID=2928852 RepID=UPI001FB49E0D|nr:hypothetical protein [Rhodococcus sp. ARC_M6]MCJ0906508.1 hypothetical protein [Rhodococcus sp. ARC_M6]